MIVHGTSALDEQITSPGKIILLFLERDLQKMPDLHTKESLPRIISILQIQMPIVRRIRLADLPRLIKCLQHFLGQWSLLTIPQILIQLLKTADPNNNPIITILNIQRRVVDNPSQCRLHHS